MALASRMSGHSVLTCALAGTGVIVVTVSVASAAERSRSRFVSMVLAPLLETSFWESAWSIHPNSQFAASINRAQLKPGKTQGNVDGNRTLQRDRLQRKGASGAAHQD